MNIIIAGVGKVGYRLAKTLSINNNIFVIDSNEEALNKLQETIDIMTIIGDIKNPETFKTLLDKSFDIFIAVTDSDDANILSCVIIDDVIHVEKKIIRLRNQYFKKSSIIKKLNIDYSVFPIIETANSVKSLLEFPKANNLKNFLFTDFKLVSIIIKEDIEIQNLENGKLTIVGIERNKKFFISNKDEILQKNDLVYLFGNIDNIKNICSLINKDPINETQKITILGADLLGIEIAKMLLLNKNNQIKIIEEDIKLCKKASEILQNEVTIINEKFINDMLYKEENLKNSNMFIITNNNEEKNIVKALEAKENGIKKIITINNNLEYYNLLHNFGITIVRGPKINAYYAILEQITTNNIITEKHFCGGEGVVFIRKISTYSMLIDKTIKPLKNENLISFYIRNDEIYSFDTEITLQDNDLIVVFAKSLLEGTIKKWIFNL
jgi:trk system potassium uptake protein TrkA